MSPLVSDELRAVVEPLLRSRRVSRKGGRPPLGDRAVLTGIHFVLRSRILLRVLPREMGRGFGGDVLTPITGVAHQGV